ncbi:MAG TPA: Clp protease ClpC, partial [Prolixibacteraceae bacterium]|nr:Clp protease ClpC [Prolixibacteraceae bacterium]
MSYSREEAIRLGNEYIGLEHIFLGILRDGEGIAIDILTNLGINLTEVKMAVENKLRKEKEIDPQASVQLLKSAEKALKIVYLEARSMNSSTINTGHLLLAILKEKESEIASILSEFHINYYILKSRMEDYKQPEAKSDYSSDDDDDEAEESFSKEPNAPKKTSGAKSETPVLDNFGIDITKAAEENSLDPIVGRENEIERLAQILSRRKKNNPILIGD